MPLHCLGVLAFHSFSYTIWKLDSLSQCNGIYLNLEFPRFNSNPLPFIHIVGDFQNRTAGELPTKPQDHKEASHTGQTQCMFSLFRGFPQFVYSLMQFDQQGDWFQVSSDMTHMILLVTHVKMFSQETISAESGISKHV